MRKIFTIAWKDALLRFTSPAEWLFFLILPLVFTLVLAGGTGVSADQRVRLTVADLAQSPLSADLIAALEQSAAVRPVVKAAAAAEEEFKNRQVSALLVIPAGFDQAHLTQGPVELEVRQQPNNLNAQVAYRAVLAAGSRMGSALAAAAGSTAEAQRIRAFPSEAERAAYFEAALKAAQTELSAAPNRLAVTVGTTPDTIEYDPRANSSAGQMITWVFIPLIGISGMFAYERQQGTLRRLLVTPTHRATYLLGTISGQVGLALVQMLLLIGFGAWVLGLNWGSSPAALGVVMLSSALAAAALGTTLGTFVKTEGQASGISILLGMVMGLLGGCWYPLELFPAFVQTAVKVLPTTWAMQGMLDIVLRGQGLAGVLPEAGVLLGFAALFFVIGVRRFRYE